MTITTYGDLQTAVQNWYKDTSTTFTDRVPEFIALAEDRLALDLRIREMEETTPLTISSRTTELPTGFVAVRRLYLTDADSTLRRLSYETPATFWLRPQTVTTQNATPSIFTIEGDNLVVSPVPSPSVTASLLYWKRLTAFASSSDTNSVLTNWRGVYLYASLLEAAIYLEDDAAALKYGTLYEDLLERIHKADQRDRFPHGELRVKTDVVGY